MTEKCRTSRKIQNKRQEKHCTVIEDYTTGKLFFKDSETTCILLILGLRGNSVIILSSSYFKYLNSTELIYKSIQKPTCMPQIKTEDHSYQLIITTKCKFYCSLLLKIAKLNAEYPVDNQSQNESVFFMWHTSVSVPEPIYCWSFLMWKPVIIFHIAPQTLNPQHKHLSSGKFGTSNLNCFSLSWAVVTIHSCSWLGL